MHWSRPAPAGCSAWTQPVWMPDSAAGAEREALCCPPEEPALICSALLCMCTCTCTSAADSPILTCTLSPPWAGGGGGGGRLTSRARESASGRSVRSRPSPPSPFSPAPGSLCRPPRSFSSAWRWRPSPSGRGCSSPSNRDKTMSEFHCKGLHSKAQDQRWRISASHTHLLHSHAQYWLCLCTSHLLSPFPSLTRLPR